MSVTGIDVGNAASCVCVARKRGVDVLLNKESKRETPAFVNFGEKMRFLGTDGYGKMGLAPTNTVYSLKRLLGKKFNDPQVQTDISKLPFKVSEGPDGGCLVSVQFLNEPALFTPEQVMAMILVDLKKIAEMETGVPPVDCVLTIPVFYDEAQRYAMINAAQIAGLNCLRLMHENTATALAYGIFKTDLSETDPVYVAFVDVGDSATQVSIVSLKKSGLQVLCHTWDANLGGRDFDELLFNHFAAEFKQRFKIDIPSNKKASFKLRVALEKMKKILSANPEAPVNVECIMEDTDVRGSMKRDDFEALGEPLVQRFRAVLEQAMAESGITADQLSSVEVIGSSTRMPMLTRQVESVFNKPASRTLNAKEVVSRGAALQCAMLSPVFKVRDFDVVDSCPYPIDFHWEKDGKPTSQRLFDKNSAFPSAKMLTFLRAAPFSVTAVNAATGTKLGDYAVGPFNVPTGQETAKLKVKVRMNLHGLASVEGVQAIEEEEVADDVKMDDAAAAPAAPDAAGAAPMDTDAAAKAAEEGAKKKKVKKTDVPFTTTAVAGYSKKQLDDYFEKEGQMQANDKLQEDTAEAKNAVEAYVLKLRHGLYGNLDGFIKESDKATLMDQLQAAEDWLYDEGEDCMKSVYVAKLKEMQALGSPVEQRAAEAEGRAAAVEALRSTCQGYLTWAASSEAKYAHISAEERAPVAAEAQASLNWLNEKVALQSSLAKHDDPVLLCADCYKKVDTLERLARPVVNKPVPKPAAAPKPAEATPAADSNGPAPMDSEAASEGTPGPEQPKEDTPMEGGESK